MHALPFGVRKNAKHIQLTPKLARVSRWYAAQFVPARGTDSYIIGDMARNDNGFSHLWDCKVQLHQMNRE